MIQNVLNPKALEKQLKILDSRLQELQKEVDGLEKMRTACLVLLTNAVETPTVEGAAPAVTPTAKAPRGKTTPETLRNATVELLRERAEGVSVDGIIEALKERQVAITGKNPSATITDLLKKAGESFVETEEGRWVLAPGAANALPVGEIDEWDDANDQSLANA